MAKLHNIFEGMGLRFEGEGVIFRKIWTNLESVNLLSRSGKLVHIDFGYILGRDPKPLPPPMKLSKEMIEGISWFGKLIWSKIKIYNLFV